MQKNNIFCQIKNNLWFLKSEQSIFDGKVLNMKSRRFIYFNDDFSFQAPVCMSDFWTEEKGYKVYQNGPVPKKVLDKKCSEECVSVKLGDGTCDKECNTLACLWDGDDCDGVTPEGSQEQGSSSRFKTPVKLKLMRIASVDP